MSEQDNMLPPGWTVETIREACGNRYSNRHYRDKGSWGFMEDDLFALLRKAYEQGRREPRPWHPATEQEAAALRAKVADYERRLGLQGKCITFTEVPLTEEQREGLRVKNEVSIPGAKP